MQDPRSDPFLDTVVHIVESRQGRPNLPSDRCPFCVGGLEAPEPYEVKSFPNRWPALGEGNCEVVLYSSQHDATFHGLGTVGVRKVIDLWADRTAALLGRPGTEYVMVFENRGAEVGATISHPHGQIYAFDHTPARIARLFSAGWEPDNAAERQVRADDHFIATTTFAPVFPVTVSVAPKSRTGRLDNLSDEQRTSLAATLVDVLARLDRLFDTPLPYMMWVNQAPSSGAGNEWMNIEIVSPWRGRDVPRYIAAAEVAGGEYFNPVNPEELAATLRDLA
ncbi:MAG: galactose-phosphate uridylyltransferase [Actinomycetota bacterium]